MITFCFGPIAKLSLSRNKHASVDSNDRHPIAVVLFLTVGVLSGDDTRPSFVGTANAEFEEPYLILRPAPRRRMVIWWNQKPRWTVRQDWLKKSLDKVVLV